MNLKLLFYINILGGGGAERVIVNLSNYFASKTGTEVVLVASYPVKEQYEVNDGVDLRYLVPMQTNDAYFKKNLRYIKELRSIIKNEQPDVTLAFMPEPNFRLLIASIGLKCKKIVSVRNAPEREYASFFYKVLAKILYRCTDMVVFQTNEAKKFFSKKIQKKSVVIMNQVNEKFFDTAIVKRRKDIVTIGRLTEQKNHKLLICSFSKICDKIEDNLIIYGEGPLRDDLTDFIKEKGLTGRVFLPGYTSDVIGSIKDAKVFVLSSDYEGMPNALLEAMALGIPCVSTDCPCGGPREIIKNGENGFLVPTNNADVLAKKMFELVNNEDLQKEFSQKARESAEKFKPNKIFVEWEKVLLNK